MPSETSVNPNSILYFSCNLIFGFYTNYAYIYVFHQYKVSLQCLKIIKNVSAKNTASYICTWFSNTVTVFENYPKCRIWILAFSTNFCPIKTDLSGNTVWQQASRFQKLAKLSIIDIFNELLSTQNINVVRSQCWMIFFCEFQTPCGIWIFFNDFQTLCFTKV